MTRIVYLVPGPLHRTSLGQAEVDRRQSLLADLAPAGIDVEVRCVDSGPATIESAYEEYLAVPGAARLLTTVAAEGADAVILGCFGDPGLDGLRELVDVPVVGAATSAIATAITLGHRFSILTVVEGVIEPLRKVVRDAGCEAALASVRAVDVSVKDVVADRDTALKRLAELGWQAIADDGADTLVLGCMSMGFAGVAAELGAELGVPVVNPVTAALHHAVALTAQGLTHSRRAYPTPAKLAAGASLHDLYLS